MNLWLPGFTFGLGTLLMQGAAGALFGGWLARRGLSSSAIRRIGLTTAARTLSWGGGLFVLFGLVSAVFPRLAELSITTPIHVHNLHTLGLEFLLLIVIVVGIGGASLFTLIRRALKHPEGECAMDPEMARSVVGSSADIPTHAR